MAKTFYLIRHGDKAKAVGDPPLSEKGVGQAKVTAVHIARYPIQQIIASPKLRTQQTARFLADKLGLDIQTESLLRERVDWGDDPEQSYDDFLAMWERTTLERDWNPPVGDSSRGSGKRLQHVIETHNEPHEHVALITHGGSIIDFVLNVFDHTKLERALPGFSRTKENNVFECSVTIVEYDPKSKQYRLKLLASADHLAHL